MLLILTIPKRMEGQCFQAVHSFCINHQIRLLGNGDQSALVLTQSVKNGLSTSVTEGAIVFEQLIS